MWMVNYSLIYGNNSLLFSLGSIFCSHLAASSFAAWPPIIIIIRRKGRNTIGGFAASLLGHQIIKQCIVYSVNKVMR